MRKPKPVVSTCSSVRFGTGRLAAGNDNAGKAAEEREENAWRPVEYRRSLGKGIGLAA